MSIGNVSYQISFVISPHGFGHLTRQIALGKELTKQRRKIKLNYICSQNHFKKFEKLIKFNDNVTINELPSFTPQFMMKDANVIDIETSIENFRDALEVDADLLEEQWTELLQGTSLVINDLESIHNPVARNLNIPIINISNFTWSDILNGLGLHKIACNYAELEKLADISYQLPFATECLGFGSNYQKFGILSQDINWDWVSKIQKSHQDEKFVFFTRVGSNIEEHLSDLLLLLESNNIKAIIPEEYNKRIDPSISYISYSNRTLNVQDLIALSKIAIGKTGYSTISEVITAGTLYIHWTRKEFIEDLYLSEALIQEGNGIRIDYLNEENLIKLLFDLIVDNIDHDLKPRKNSNPDIAASILKFLDNI